MDIHQPKNKVLNSWKEISQYLGRGMRTVQRWEQKLGLPVRRPRGKKRSAVIAIPAELDAWATSSLRLTTRELDEEPAASKLVTAADCILLSQGLRAKNRRLRRDVSITLLSLLARLKRIQESHTEDNEPSLIAKLMDES
jgi:hypothetical protein